MKIKGLVFLLIFVFSIVMPSLSAVNTNSGSTSSAPSLVFKSRRAGRGEPNRTTFITSTETTCWVEASVGYSGNLPRNTTAPIDPSTVSWAFTLTHEMSLESLSTSWSGSHPSKLLENTSFNVLAKLSVPKHTRTSSCTLDAKRASRTPQHRKGTPMEITIQFTAQTTQGHPLSLQKTLKQDEIDQIRQIHVDMGRYIPASSAFVSDYGDREPYDFGHYKRMLYEDLKGKHAAWAKAINTEYRKSSGLNDLPNLSLDHLFLTSGYRDPHHNDYHAGSTARHSLHQYGLALDVRGMDIDGIEGEDQEKMELAARLVGARYTDTYPDTRHVHADWRPSGWPPSGPGSAPTFSLPAQSSDSALAAPPTPPPTTHPTNPTTPDPDPPSVLCGNSNRGAGACSSGRVASSASAHQTTCLAGHTYWSCNASEVTAHASHTAPVLCGNSNRGAGACSSGRVVSSASAHQTTCLAGHTYWSCNTSAVSVHASHTAPVPVPVRPARAKCRARSWTGCEGWAGDHDAVCPAGHSYYTCNASAVAAHSRH